MTLEELAQLVRRHKHDGIQTDKLDLENIEGILGIDQGGTGAVLVDPGADRILFWDDSAGQFTFLTAGSGLSISGTTLTASSPTATTLIPQSVAPIDPGNTNAILITDLPATTTMFVGQVLIPFSITANTLRFWGIRLNSGDTVDISLYSEDGQTRLFSVTSDELTAGQDVNSVSLSAVTITPGIYWIAVNPNAAGCDVGVWDTENDNSGIGLINITGEALQGILTITAGTPPSTIVLADITVSGTGDKTLYFRLDN